MCNMKETSGMLVMSYVEKIEKNRNIENLEIKFLCIDMQTYTCNKLHVNSSDLSSWSLFACDVSNNF